MNQLDASNENIQRAQRALERAYNTYDLNERLRCLHHAGQFIKDSWNQITDWRKGYDGKNDRQDACPTNVGARHAVPGTDEPSEAQGTSVAADQPTKELDPGSKSGVTGTDDATP
jgi:hypothetical protein